MRHSTGTTSNHAGTTDEYLFFDHHIFAFDLECGQDFQPPIPDAIPAAGEVAAAVRSLGWWAAGETGLNIAALLQQRTSVTDRTAAPSISTPAPEKAWYVQALPARRAEIIASADDLEELGLLGFATVVVRDVLED